MLAQYLRQLAPLIPDVLIGPDALKKICETALLIPESALVNTFGFECALNNSDTKADFLVSFQNKTRGAGLLLQTAMANAEQSPVWEDVVDLANLWEEKHRIDDFWLEFDLWGNAPLVPSLFFRPLYSTTEELGYILDDTLSYLTGNKGNNELLKKQIINLVSLLPERAAVFQIGAMRSRSVEGVRLCMNEISLDAIIKFLKEIRYKGPVKPVEDLLIFLQPIAHDVTFSLDVQHDGAGSKIGFECYADRKLPDEERLIAWEKMLNVMNQHGLAEIVKAGCLKKLDFLFDPEQFFTSIPPELLLARALMKNHAASVMKQYLHHVKVSYSPECPLQTKAYVAVQHVWC